MCVILETGKPYFFFAAYDQPGNLVLYGDEKIKGR